MKNTHIIFNKDRTQILKGIALIIMIIHHTIGSGIWVENNPLFYDFIVRATKLCVYVFAFLVGYGFCCSQNKSYRYSLKRILLLLIPFWTILLGLFLPLSYFSGTLQELSVLDVIYNMFGISLSLNWYSWFVAFYILAILSLPILSKFIDKQPAYGWIIILFGYYLLAVCIHSLSFWEANPIIYSLFNYSIIMPNVVLGFMCAKWNKEGKVPNWLEGQKRIWLCVLVIIIVLVVQGLNFPTRGIPVSAFITTFFIFAVLGIFNSFQLKSLKSFLIKIGDVSMYMWFFHAIFFTTSVNQYTKHLVFEPFHCFFYTFIVTFVLTYICSWIIKKTLIPIISRIK